MGNVEVSKGKVERAKSRIRVEGPRQQGNNAATMKVVREQTGRREQ